MKQKNLNITDIQTASEEEAEKLKKAQHLQDIIEKSSEETSTPEKLEEIVLKSSQKKPTNAFVLTKNWKIAIAIVTVIAILSVPLYLIIQVFFFPPTYDSSLINISKPYFEPNSLTNKENRLSSFTLESPTEPKTNENPINGELLTKTEYDTLMKRLPVAVMVNNHPAARPQSSLTKADIVFETIAESGITRYMPIYWSEDVNVVGPIRSARQYYIDWLSSYDAIYIHDGCASSTDPKVNACGNIYSMGIKSVATYGAWREYDGVRFAPHNEYSSIVLAWKRAGELNWEKFPTTFVPWDFKRDAVVTERGNVKEATVIFSERLNNGGAYDVKWVYDKDSNSFLRYIGGVKDIDQENDQQVASKTVIIQSVKMTPTYDEKAHLIFDIIGQGDATILMDGTATKVTWKKTSRTAQTRYFTADGKEFIFNRGQVWVQGVPISEGKFAIIENS